MAADVRTLNGAAYASAKAKALRDARAPQKSPSPPTIPLEEMTPEQYAASRPRAVREMDAAEYAQAKRAAIRGRR